MFSERALRELASVETQGPILSVYLNVDPTRRTAEEYKLELREMLRTVNGDADPEDSEAIKRYIELDFDWSRGLRCSPRRADDIGMHTRWRPVRSGSQ